ncbi:MAG: hypothetical protein J3Q66DRAFT_392712 [Benniella sp.]|nr:MAG: hypothetical protein J3Q66DRAFT_392712 [Benniella sp.]
MSIALQATCTQYFAALSCSDPVVVVFENGSCYVNHLTEQCDTYLALEYSGKGDSESRTSRLGENGCGLKRFLTSHSLADHQLALLRTHWCLTREHEAKVYTSLFRPQ